MVIEIKRVYSPQETDEFRILVDRLWPRGLKKETANIDVWMKEVAPSPSLRKWFNHDPEKWEVFSKEYEAELEKSGAVKELLRYLEKHGKVTLLYAAKDEEHNHALVLKNFLNKVLRK